MHKVLRATLIAVVTSVLTLSLFAPLQKVSALSGSDFNPGNIMEDSTFFNGGAMAAWDIQSFLNAKLPSCDTNGNVQKTYSYNGQTVTTSRAVYAERLGYPTPPYACLKDVVHDSVAKSPDAYCSGSTTAGRKSSAQIIYDVGAACSVSQKVLLVLLQKEQSLVTDDWPWPNQYRAATGYGCPDTAPCDAEYYGFFNQVYNAAHQFQRYAKSSASFRYRSGRDNFIQYNPDAGCGGSNVYIQNNATAGLYNYTPYQPNAAALNNLYGSGDSCSAYGNRNFWRLFADWFGPQPIPPMTIAHPDGTLVRPANSPRVYVLKDGKAAFGTSLGVLLSWGYDLSRVKIATPGDLNLLAATDADTTHTNNPAPLQYREGTLVKGSGPTVYVVQNVSGTNQKRSLDTLANFTRLGYNFGDVITVPDADLPASTGSVYDASNAAHPSGSLVRSANSPTVYYVINGERHSMSSLNVFISQRFKFSQVKIATSGDEQLPITWPVTWFGEGTLVKGSGPTVYIIDLDISGVNMSKRNMVSYNNFVGYDYRFNEVMNVSDNELPVNNGADIGN